MKERDLRKLLERHTPEEIVERAKELGCDWEAVKEDLAKIVKE